MAVLAFLQQKTVFSDFMCATLAQLIGKINASKTDEFLEKFRRGGGGSFPIQKFMLEIFAILKGTSVMNFGKKSQHDFPKIRFGGDKLP